MRLRIIELSHRVNEYYSERNEDMRLEFEMMRKQTCDLINIQLKKEDRLTPVELWPAPWDHQQPNELSEAEILENNKALNEALDAFINKQNG